MKIKVVVEFEIRNSRSAVRSRFTRGLLCSKTPEKSNTEFPFKTVFFVGFKGLRTSTNAGCMTLPLVDTGTCRVHRVSQEECARLREGVLYVKVYRYNPKHLCPKFNGYGDNGQKKVGASCGSKYCNLHR